MKSSQERYTDRSVYKGYCRFPCFGRNRDNTGQSRVAAVTVTSLTEAVTCLNVPTVRNTSPPARTKSNAISSTVNPPNPGIRLDRGLILDATLEVFLRPEIRTVTGTGLSNRALRLSSLQTTTRGRGDTKANKRKPGVRFQQARSSGLRAVDCVQLGTSCCGLCAARDFVLWTVCSSGLRAVDCVLVHV
ncbi:hypothetical protein J6590_021604 [Homalodisca vitripennis]|nr:hypothetical protein J6590_021604 [Homalodisca vitripennis]